MIETIIAASGLLIGYGISWGVSKEQARKSQSDLNGLGKKFGRLISYQLRCLAEEEPISKIKLLYIADMIEPHK
jgi:hypothetical protein